MKSEEWRKLATQYLALLSPSGNFPNWGGALQNDGCSAGDDSDMYVYFFERAATDFGSPDFAWAAQQLWSSYIPESPPKPSEWTLRSALEVRGRRVPVEAADFVEQKSTVVMRNTFDVPVPDKLVVAASRRPGSAYAMLEAFAVPIGFHGTEEQTGGFLHYEFNSTLFFYNSWSKHNKQGSMAVGAPIIYPDTAVGSKVFPYIYGKESVPPQSGNQWHQEDAATDRFWNGWDQDWD